MSNDLVSQFPISDRQVVQMEHFSSSLDLPVSAMNMKMTSHVSSDAESNLFSVSKEHRGLVEPSSSNPLLTVPNNRMVHNESSGGSMSSSPMWMSNQQGQKDAFMLHNIAGEKTAYSVKRKAELGPQLTDSISQQSLLPNKRPALMKADVNSYGFLYPSAPQRKTAPAQSKLVSPGLQAQPLLNKKMVRNDSLSGKSASPRGQTAKKTVQIESTSKVQPESLEALRSKMRESLAAALALAFQNQEIASCSEKNQSATTTDHQMPLNAQVSESISSVGGQASISGSGEILPSNESSMVERTNDFQVFPAELPPNASSGQTFHEYQYTSILPDEEVPFSNNFFAKDDLLQGNGLSWAFNMDVQMRVGKEAQYAEKPKSVKEETQGHIEQEQVAILTPENLVFKIEAELFKLFGGVNKKYKEKGRSLLFNLKDRNNPELRERVMSSEISPERLCSMSAEELASKELSQWRMAKAEEMAQMVVLPEVDIRRFVRKTHKGEYQVEVQHDDGIAAEVSSGSSMLTQSKPKKEIEPHSPSEESLKDKENVARQESIAEDQDFLGSLIIPTDGTDLMQGMIVDDLKDVEFLPPIVSLDEFMESLNSEPPFENLAAEKTPISHGESPKPVNNSLASNRASDSPKDASSKQPDIIKKYQVDMSVKLSGSPAKDRVLPSVVSKVDYIWEGILQLTISSSVTVGGLFQSGEKTSTKEWPTSLEIKGRVRVDAFEKFLQQLPMSRTRAVMVLEFALTDKSSKNEVSDLSEAVDSYTVDERLGFAEPGPGIELYLCPPTPRMADMLNKHLSPKDRPQTDNNSIEKGLIGVVVWRRAHINNMISPNSSSHHKKQPFVSPPKSVHDSSHVNVNVFNKASHSNPQTEEDDDVPPGFGHVAAARVAKDDDDDDLPEFNFSQNLYNGVNMNQRPVDQVRELIQKYGQSGTNSSRGFGIKPVNVYDDDDIPEWTPQAYPVVHGHQPPVNIHSSNQHMVNLVTQQPPPRGIWSQPRGSPYGAGWRHH
ncbi:hypothetical protein BUALT_Bualt10G0107900 [Buddleja alternifolia]|uniref:TFIIS central domain-containing protein n=1 Tax=Buddleja alternifolia TaxID=168488 RepID=A0AAV6WYF6_9LAMI|nr:hypothetical protein BUALT_Bualt10G0107900 [Buddleja alternifolia]